MIMKIFAKETMVGQYKIDGFPFDVDLCCPVHKLAVEVDEDGHVYYNEEQYQIRQKLIENLGFTFITINPHVENFDLDVEIATIYNYINKSSVRLAANSAEKSLKEKFAKELLSYISSFSKFLKPIRYFVKKILPTIYI